MSNELQFIIGVCIGGMVGFVVLFFFDDKIFAFLDRLYAKFHDR